MEAASQFESPRTVVRKFYEAFNAHSLGKSKGILSSNVVVETSGGVSAKGREEAIALFRGWWEAFPDARAEVTDLVASGDTVVTESTFTGTHRGVLRAPGLDAAPSGRAVIIPRDIHWFKLRRGLIVSIDLTVDRLDIQTQLGGQAA